jgi:hypothetical protein
MADNLKLPPKEVLCALINRTNAAVGAALTPELVSFGLPSQASGGTYNTDITVTAVEGSGYIGAEVINYNRLHLQAEIADAFVASGQDRNLEFSVGNATKIADIVPEINQRFGINLTAADFTDGDLPEFTGVANETHNVQVIANADSLCYRGSFTFILKAEDVLLSSVIVEKTMNGLTYAPPA